MLSSNFLSLLNIFIIAVLMCYLLFSSPLSFSHLFYWLRFPGLGQGDGGWGGRVIFAYFFVSMVIFNWNPDTVNFILLVAKFKEILIQISGTLLMHHPLSSDSCIHVLDSWPPELWSLSIHSGRLLASVRVIPPCGIPWKLHHGQKVEAILGITSISYFYFRNYLSVLLVNQYKKYISYFCTFFQLFKRWEGIFVLFASS